jgi:lipopolysaccharide export system permease protein
MRILDRYIARNIVSVFFLVILIFCLIYVLIDSATNLDEFISRKVPLSVLVTYYLSFLPTIIVQTSAMACLIAVLITFSTLNSHNEIIALRTSGMTFWQISKPAITLSLILSAMIFFLNERYIPQAEMMVKKIQNENMNLEGSRKLKKKAKIENLTFYGLKNRLYFIDSFDPNTYDLEGITIISYDEAQNIKEKIVALDGKWSGIAWKFRQCHVTSFAESINAPTRVKIYQEKLMDIKETPEDFLRQRLEVKSMNIQQLQDYIQRFSNSGARRALNNLKVDLYQKMAFPLTNLIIVLVSLPLTLTIAARRMQTLAAITIALLISFLYYVCNAVGLALGKGNLLNPLTSAWLAPIIFLGIAYYLIRTRFE